ncbi:MAG TPA: DUF72 domain-containing protein [Cyclobacteriaceae bacterium]|jgi:uncharacterized protein YecE (DUF72 family)|nr:MAG: DUF72 domain-containing protein [Bacteroidota bacterium]
MEFGKVDATEFDSIDFTLPPDDVETQRVLAKAKGQGTVKVYTGCAKWGRKEWIGRIYPEGTKEDNFLNLYAQHFNCVELNATFYKLPSVRQVEAWKAMVRPGFLFCPKFNDKITHKKRLKDADELTQVFLKGIAAFGENLGPVFLQTPPNFATKNFDVLRQYLESLPGSLDIFVELRHPGWFSDAELKRKVFDLFEQRGVGAVITDAAGRRDCVHMRLTTPSAFIRFVGNSLHPTDYTRCDDWVRRIGQWVEQGLQRVFFLMHQQEEVYSPELCRYFIRKVNESGFASLPEPKFANES